MSKVSISELRKKLPTYVEYARRGVETRIMVKGKVVALIVPDMDAQEAARARLLAIRESSRVGEISTRSGIEWEVERDHRRYSSACL